jgi:hypothetical protein
MKPGQRFYASLGLKSFASKAATIFSNTLTDRCTVVPMHRGEMIGRGLLAQILRDCDLLREERQDKT